MTPLSPNDKIDIEEVLQALDAYRPRRKGWTWRQRLESAIVGPFRLQNTSAPLKRSVPLPSAHYMGNIDPQCDMVITTEIASGRFEDDIRRMRMAAWHGADHIMVIRTMGQSHIDGLLEGTPEGVGGIPITRKQVRATRKALDAIEDEVGRPINFHSYVSGVAGPEIAVMFAEEGVNGAHQDPQYNILYRNINMHRSIVDAAEAKAIMVAVGMLQIDGHAQGSDRLVNRAAHSPARSQVAARCALCDRLTRPVSGIQISRPAKYPLHGIRHGGSNHHTRLGHLDLPPDLRRYPEHDHPG
jgi:D-ornithine 4,5-aminomutase subunit beta